MFISQCNQEQKRSSLTGFLGRVQVSETVLFTPDKSSPSPPITVHCSASQFPPTLPDQWPSVQASVWSEAMTLTLHVCESICSQSWLGSLALSPLPHSGHVSLFTITNDHIGPPSPLSPRPGHTDVTVSPLPGLSLRPPEFPRVWIMSTFQIIFSSPFPVWRLARTDWAPPPSLWPWAGLRMRGSSAQQHSGAGSDKMPGSGPGTGTHSISDTRGQPAGDVTGHRHHTWHLQRETITMCSIFNVEMCVSEDMDIYILASTPV